MEITEENEPLRANFERSHSRPGDEEGQPYPTLATIGNGSDDRNEFPEFYQDDDEEAVISLFIFWVTFVAAFSGLLFGYDTGVISGVLVTIKDSDLGHLTSFDKELITSATTFAALISSLIAGTLADIIGRKWVIGIADVVFVFGAVIQAVAHRLWIMIVGRFIIGLGVGLAALVVPLYITELAPARLRGRLVVINVIFITFGQVVAYLFSLAFRSVPNGWRIMVGLGVIPPIFQTLILFWLPETPRFLTRQGKLKSAKIVLSKIYPLADEQAIDQKVDFLRRYCQIEIFSDQSLPKRLKLGLKLLFSKNSNIRALFIACGLQAFQQLCGFNSLMYYSATIFQFVGFKNAIGTSLIVSCTNFVFTCFAFIVIDRVGRRRILLWTIWGMIAGLVFCAIAFYYLPKIQGSPSEIDSSQSSGWAPVILVSMLVYVASYALGIGNVPWQQSELFPMEVRGLGVSIATASNWTSNSIVSSTFLTLLNSLLGPTGTFLLYAASCVMGELFVLFFYPEFAGMVLEEIHEVLENGFGIKEANTRQEEMRLGRQRENMWYTI